MDEGDRITKLLQPEFLTVEELCEVLKACCVKNDLTSYSKSQLIELFKRVALPLPQREYGNSWRERLLCSKQKRKNMDSDERDNVKKVCRTTSDTSSNSSQLSSNKTSNGSTVHTKITQPSNLNRLKPPINLANYTKKVLKLALPDSKKNECSIQKDLIIKDKKTQEVLLQKENSKLDRSEKSLITNGKHKRIVIDFSDSTSTSTKTPKVISLKRSTKSEVVESRQKIRKVV